MTERSLGSRWRATTVPYLVLRGSGQAAEFLGWVILARRLGTSVFGDLSVAVLICRYGGLVADFGASIRGVRDVAEGRGTAAIRALIRRRTQLSFVLGGIYVIGCLLLGSTSYLGLVVMLLGIGMNRDWIALGLERGGRSGAPVAVQGILLVLVATVAPVHLPALAPAVAYGVALALSLAVNRVPQIPGEVSDEVRIDGWMLVAIIANQVLSSADVLLLAWLDGSSSAGIYAAVYRIPNAWLALLVILRGGLLPMATDVLARDREQFLGLRRSSLKWSGIAAGSLCVLTVPAYFLVPVIFGEAYAPGQWPTVLLLLATAVATIGAPLHHLFLAFGDDRPYAWYLVAAAGLNVAVNLILIPPYGMMGAAIATVLANVLLAGLLWSGLEHRIHRRTDRSDSRLLGPKTTRLDDSERD